MAKKFLKPMLPVKRVIRRQGSAEYLNETGWTEHEEEATSFSDAIEAIETCVRLGLDHVELVLRTCPKGCDVYCTLLR